MKDYRVYATRFAMGMGFKAAISRRFSAVLGRSNEIEAPCNHYLTFDRNSGPSLRVELTTGSAQQ
jgi:hypothetical protein